VAFSCCNLQLLDVAAAHKITPATKAHFWLLLLGSCLFLCACADLDLDLDFEVQLGSDFEFLDLDFEVHLGSDFEIGLGLRSPSRIGLWALGQKNGLLVKSMAPKSALGLDLDFVRFLEAETASKHQ
jgi:hypothetical protein